MNFDPSNKYEVQGTKGTQWVYYLMQISHPSGSIQRANQQTKANGLEPYAYLKQVFTELPKATCVEDIEALLPFKPQSELDQAA